MARTLFLHLSALSNEEYDSYMGALHDILGNDGELTTDQGNVLTDEEHENQAAPLLVVRAWMRGRFRDIGPDRIEQVLALFAPQLKAKQMSGGQILAALRLLMHARCGGEINEKNVFVQARPSSPTNTRFPNPFAKPAATDKEECPRNLPEESLDAKPYLPPKSNIIPTSMSTPPDATHDPSSSPRRASLSDVTQRPPPVPPSSSKPRMEGSGVPPGGNNPFLQRARTHSGAYNTSSTNRTPPLPPRKPSYVRPQPPTKPANLASSTMPLLQRTATGASSSTMSSKSSTNVHGPSVLPPPHHITPLMQQSLMASRAGESAKRAKDEASRTRNIEVIRSSADSVVQALNARSKSGSHSPEKGERKRRPVPLPPRQVYPSVSAQSDSGAPSETSLAQVAGARLPSRARTASPGPSTVGDSDDDDNTESKNRVRSTSEQFDPPPVHPARRPSVHSTPGRANERKHIRSPSYHVQSPFRQQFQSSSPFATSASSPNFPEAKLPSSPDTPESSYFTGTSQGMFRSSRSQSMHSPVSPTLAGRLSGNTSPPPSRTTREGPELPPRRKRPESMQVPPKRNNPFSEYRSGEAAKESPFANNSNSREAKPSEIESTSRLFRELSIERDRDPRGEREATTPFATLQRTFSALQQRAQPSITRARYKAEAGLNPKRGYAPSSFAHGYSKAKSPFEGGFTGNDDGCDAFDGQRLVSQHGTGDESEAGMDSDFGVLEGEADDADDNTVRGRVRGGRKALYDDSRWKERDNLKLPEGDGWTPL